ncbi:hypothetical protein COP2_044601 [Malus domestica]
MTLADRAVEGEDREAIFQLRCEAGYGAGAIPFRHVAQCASLIPSTREKETLAEVKKATVSLACCVRSGSGEGVDSLFIPVVSRRAKDAFAHKWILIGSCGSGESFESVSAVQYETLGFSCG